MELNQGPRPYQGRALTKLSYAPDDLRKRSRKPRLNILTESAAEARGVLLFLRIFVSAGVGRERLQKGVVERHVAVSDGEEFDDVRSFGLRVTDRRGARRQRLGELEIAERTFRQAKIEFRSSGGEEESRTESETFVISAFRKTGKTRESAASAFDPTNFKFGDRL